MPVVRKPWGVFFLRKKMGLDPTLHANLMEIIDGRSYSCAACQISAVILCFYMLGLFLFRVAFLCLFICRTRSPSKLSPVESWRSFETLNMHLQNSRYINLFVA